MTNQHASELGKLGGRGRMKIPAKKRSEIARRAARARWKGHKAKRPTTP